MLWVGDDGGDDLGDNDGNDGAFYVKFRAGSFSVIICSLTLNNVFVEEFHSTDWRPYWYRKRRRINI